MAVHSKIGASSYSRWSKIHGGCPGSVRQSQGCPNVESEYAKEGTHAHTVASERLEKYFFMKLPPKPAVSHPEMDESVDVYVNYIKEQAKLAKASVKAGHVLIEHKFNLEKVHPGLFGTADAVIYWPLSKKLQVIDYKHGAGIAVEVEDNLQLQYYGLGALLSIDLPCDEVELVVVQPRCEHEDGKIRTWKFKSYEIIDFAADLADDAAATEDPFAPLNPGKHCRFCPAAAANCPAVMDKAQAMAKLEFKPIEKGGYDPANLDMALKFLPALEAWITKVREFAYAEAVHGRTPLGWKMVSKRGARRWTKPEEEIIAYMKSANPKRELKEFYTDPVLKTPAAMEKLSSKQINMGLQPMIETVSSGYNLVPESDPRPAVKLDAASEFTKIEGGE